MWLKQNSFSSTAVGFGQTGSSGCFQATKKTTKLPRNYLKNKKIK